MTAIVGPNGCGKSNISDAIRWVLGEQSAKALRGSKMEDIIFNGTDAEKPMGMAEVSLTFTDCEGVLETEYNEVTITRRVFRSGEGQYFINRAPCRLKDIQRLFMDTGVGTNSYSLMEQGRIDRILSSRPDDRREVFEEASGITKFKADKKEAIRKLDHTEANLLRLADIVKEVKRQIISLQRQAGKARRYKELQSQLRGLDLYVSRKRLEEMEASSGRLQKSLNQFTNEHDELKKQIDTNEQRETSLRHEISEMENTISNAMDASMRARSELERARQLARVNRDRIAELKALTARDNRDVSESQQKIEAYREQLTELQKEAVTANQAKEQAEADLEQKRQVLLQHENALEEKRNTLRDNRNRGLELESRLAKLQNELADMEAKVRSEVVRRERLFAEDEEMKRAVESYEARLKEMDSARTRQKTALDESEEQLKALLAGRAEKQKNIQQLESEKNRLQQERASREAKLEMLLADDLADTFPAGAQMLLNPPDDLTVEQGKILGALADLVTVDKEYQTALESVLRAWQDAVVVNTPGTLRDLMTILEMRDEGPARLLAAETANQKEAGTPENLPGISIFSQLNCDEKLKSMLTGLLGPVQIVDSLEIPAIQGLTTCTWVTRTGSILRADGSGEYWAGGRQTNNPLRKKHLAEENRQAISELDRQLNSCTGKMDALKQEGEEHNEQVFQAQQRVDDARRTFAQAQGEFQVIEQEAKQAAKRAEAVAWELQSLTQAEGPKDNRRTEIAETIQNVKQQQADLRQAIQQQTRELEEQDEKRSTYLSEMTESRVHAAECRQKVEQIKHQAVPIESQIESLETMIKERAEGVSSYENRIHDLQRQIEEADNSIEPLEKKAAEYAAAHEETKKSRDSKSSELEQLQQVMRQQRNRMEEQQNKRSQIDVHLAEQKMRKQNLLDRIRADYHINEEQIAEEPEPEWENETPPSREDIDTSIAEIRTKLESMGPVNLVAIEEYKELEERYQFLTEQQEDLINAKQQLLDMIRKINNTTTEMFSDTFNAVNENFQVMFKQLFGGGSAKLVLLDEEDVLESGIEIIARPPGKKLQGVSLLSGGERTLTAVGLLFALYMVKPSPFCLLDELDAALDESNIGRFVDTVSGFIQKSQFLVITHNKRTISAADVLYGITMEKKGVSKIVSVKFSNHENDDNPDAKEPEDSAPEE